MPVTLALINDYEVVVRGLSAMLTGYENRVRIMELDLQERVSTPVDLALYDTFAAHEGSRKEIRDVAADPMVGKAIVYSWNMDSTLISAALHNGAKGYISKNLGAGPLVTALEEIHRGDGDVYYAPGRTGSAGDWPGRQDGLTQREAEILAFIAQGLSNNEIAERSHLSINSIKSYIRSGYRRINVESRTQAVIWGLAHGFRPTEARIDRAGSPR